MYSTPLAVGLSSTMPPTAFLNPFQSELTCSPTLPSTLSDPVPKKEPAAFSPITLLTPGILLPIKPTVSPINLLTAPVTVL